MPEPRPGVPLGKLEGRRKRSSRGAKINASRWSQTWLPVVTTSAPAAIVSRKISSVIPNPPAAFSPLTMTKSSLKSEISPGSCSHTAVRPVFPTMSPRKRSLIRSRTESQQSKSCMTPVEDHASIYLQFWHEAAQPALGEYFRDDDVML